MLKTLSIGIIRDISRYLVLPLLVVILLEGCVSTDDIYDVREVKYQLHTPDSIINENSIYIAVIGDIQEYTVSNQSVEFLNKTCDWLRSQQTYFNCFSCILQNGDLTWGNTASQWDCADKALSHLGEDNLLIPSTGNHDYTWAENSEIRDRNSTKINSMQCLNTLKKLPILQYEQNHIDNIIVPIRSVRDSVFVISLEFGPRNEVVTWADSIVRANPQNKYILMTHEWLTAKGERIDTGSYASMQMPNISHTTPQEIWNQLVYPNDNILCVLCGHNGFCRYTYTPNIKGRDVCQILFNLQYQENGGNGMIQLWEFPKNENVINILVYNTITREFHPNPETSIRIQL